MVDVALLGTFETKKVELSALEHALRARNLSVDLIDLSLAPSGTRLPGEAKLAKMHEAAHRAATALANTQATAVLALGGGTGSEMALEAMHDLPISTPKFLITTLPFDPRHALADNGTILIPTLCDIQGLNASLRATFDHVASLIHASMRSLEITQAAQSIGVSLLGVTQRACDEILPRLAQHGFEPFAFHANGFGGAAFSRFVKENKISAAIDLTLNEIVRLNIGGAHTKMPDRYTCMSHTPRVVLPGAMTFFDAGPHNQVSAELLSRPHYRHSGHFTHVKLTVDEMSKVAHALAVDLNQSVAPCTVVIPMGGFSSEDSPGGAIEDEGLRELVADTLETHAVAYSVERIPNHIGDAETANVAVSRLLTNLQ